MKGLEGREREKESDGRERQREVGDVRVSKFSFC